MAINVKKSIVSMNNTYELLGERLTITDNEDNDIIVIEGIELRDLKEFFKHGLR